MILKPSPVRSDRFTWSSGEAVAEISDLGPGFEFGRVYDDACDVGLTIISQRTGQPMVMVIEREVRDREGELQFIELVPALRGRRGLFTVKLFND